MSLRLGCIAVRVGVVLAWVGTSPVSSTLESYQALRPQFERERLVLSRSDTRQSRNSSKALYRAEVEIVHSSKRAWFRLVCRKERLADCFTDLGVYSQFSRLDRVSRIWHCFVKEKNI